LFTGISQPSGKLADNIIKYAWQFPHPFQIILPFDSTQCRQCKSLVSFFQTQEREAKNKMREKAKELHRQRMEADKKGVRSPGFGGGGFGSSTNYSAAPVVGDSASVPADINKSSFTAIQ
jgi:hypothetical protein